MPRLTRAERNARMAEILARQAEEREHVRHVKGLERGLSASRRRKVEAKVDRISAAAGTLYAELDARSKARRTTAADAMERLKAKAARKHKPAGEGQVVAYRGGADTPVAAELLARRDTIGYLLAKDGIDQYQHAAGVTIRALWIAKDGGARSPDLTMIKVDGGGRVAEALRLGAYAAGRELRRILTSARLGAEDAEIVLRICGESETIMAVAIRLEENPAMTANGGCSRETADRVKLSLKRSLRFIANVIHGRPARGPLHPFQDDKVLAWIAEDARPADLAKRA